MSMIWSISWAVLKILACGFAFLNELALLSSPWICAPSPAPRGAGVIRMPSPAFTSIAYAIAEPLLVAFIASNGIFAWIPLMLSVQHLWFGALAGVYLIHLTKDCFSIQPAEISSSKIAAPEAHEKRDVERQPSELASKRVWRPAVQMYIATLFPVLTAASSNGTLLLFISDLGIYVSDKNADLLLWLSYAALVCYVASRMADVQLSQLSSRKWLWQYETLDDLRTNVVFLALLMSVKISMRMLLGHDAFPLFHIMSSRRMVPSVAPEMPPWLATAMAWPDKLPSWLRPAFKYAYIPCQAVAVYLLQKALREI